MANVVATVPLVNGDDRRSSTDSTVNETPVSDFQTPAACEQLMQRIRRRQNAKSWYEIIKISRLSLQEKRNSLVVDSNDRVQLQKCLDTMQKSIKVTSLQSMVERLETITRQLGLKFTVGPTGQDVFISSDMFYVEVVLEPGTGYVLDVKIAHHADPISCSELTRVLREADFAEFHRHLDGLSAIYQLNTDKYVFCATNAKALLINQLLNI
jgi:mediator of RNA polymerase II transcription subunit 1